MRSMKKDNHWFHTIYPWVVWLIAASFFFYKYLIQVSPSVMTSDLMKAFHVNGVGLGNLSAFYFYAYLIMQIPVGIMLDRFSPRIITTGAIFLCSLSIFAFSQTETLWMACLSRALMGVGASFAAVSCFKLASIWFAPKRFALVSGMFMTAAMLGAVGGQMPLSVLVENLGWRTALELVSLAGIILCGIYFLAVRDKEGKHNLPHVTQKVSHSLTSIISNKQTWFLSLFSGLAFAPVSVFGGLWGVPFLEIAYNLPRADAALAISSIFIGFAVGAPLLGWFSDYMERRKPILFFGTFLAFLCLTIVIYTSGHSLPMLMGLLFFFGFGTSGFFTSFAMIREVFPLTLAATVLGIMNTFDSVCEALYEPLVGLMLDLTWDGKEINGIHQFSLSAYHISLIVLPISLLLALTTLYFIQETYCKTQE